MQNVVFIKLGSRSYLPVHREVLFSQMKNIPEDRSAGVHGDFHCLDLPHITTSTCQAILHYLYTGTLDVESVLVASGSSGKLQAACRISIELLALSKTHEIKGLYEQVTRQLEERKSKLDPRIILTAIEISKQQPDSSENSWFRGYVRSLLGDAYPDLSSLLQASVENTKIDPAFAPDGSVIRLFMNLMVEIGQERQASKGF
ncbi:inhibitor of Bruton tyrosine kinase [Microdochium nivale]|nr:inhibitor of Bruton tyrosine kinase [Microdochium nivale]